MNALELLTEHCWEEILSRVEEPADLRNCNEACLAFQGILKKKKCGFMFQLILPHILKCLTEKTEQLDEEGHTRSIISYKAVFDCRLVCRSWCQSIEKLEATSRILNSPHPYQFNSGEKIKSFLQAFENHKRKPFIGRRVNMALGTSHESFLIPNNAEIGNRDGVPHEPVHVHGTKVCHLLSRFGNEIWTMTLCDPRRVYLFHLGFCKNTQTALGYLPNLRGLELFGTLNRFWNRMADAWEEFDEMEMYELPDYIASHPLPPLPYLEHLKIDGVSVMMTRFLLESYSAQLKSLVSCHLTRFPEQLPWMTNLQELELTRLDAGDSLEFLGQLSSPLQKLSLRVDYNRTNVGLWAIDKLFQNIGHLPIQKLELTIANVILTESGTISPKLRIRNESIREIRIDSRSRVSLNFLLSCPNLVSLDITLFPSLQSGRSNGIDEVLDITKRTKQTQHDLYQSNIWKMIPSLEVLDVSCMNYERYPELYSYRNTHYNKRTYDKKKKLRNNSSWPSRTLSRNFNSILDFIRGLRRRINNK